MVIIIIYIKKKARKKTTTVLRVTHKSGISPSYRLADTLESSHELVLEMIWCTPPFSVAFPTFLYCLG